MKKILLVDDENTLGLVLKKTLEQQGYQTNLVNTGMEGLVAFEKNVPDIIVSDISMPEMDGFEFCRQLRSQPNGHLVPFIFLSAIDDMEAKVKGHSLGADDYLTKPFKIEELIAKIEAAIERTRRIHAEIIQIMSQVGNVPRNYNPPKRSFSQSRYSTDSDRANLNNKPNPLPLTPAEERVFWEVIQGFTNKEISEHLFISPRTVQTHLSNILNKLQLDNRTKLVRFAFENGYEKVDI